MKKCIYLLAIMMMAVLNQSCEPVGMSNAIDKENQDNVLRDTITPPNNPMNEKPTEPGTNPKEGFIDKVPLNDIDRSQLDAIFSESNHFLQNYVRTLNEENIVHVIGSRVELYDWVGPEVFIGDLESIDFSKHCIVYGIVKTASYGNTFSKAELYMQADGKATFETTIDMISFNTMIGYVCPYAVFNIPKKDIQQINMQVNISKISSVVPAADYYWYGGEKIYLERGNQEYIIYDDALLSKIDKKKLEYTGSDEYLKNPNLKWGITKPNTVITDLEHVLYRMPSYKSGKSNIFITNSFNVKLKDSVDLPVLQSMAEQYNVEICKEGPLPLWYLLVCTLPSSSNAMDIANRFYVSGKFEVSEPNFMGGIVLL